jgi:predicted DNA-binding transcriptional regulator AlpA
MAASNENLVATVMAGPGELIDEAKLAARLGVSRSTLQSWRYGGRGPRWIKLGRLIRYRLADVDTFLEANTRGRVA